MFDTRTLIAFLGILAVGSAINPDNICALVKDGTKIVDDTNCAGYYTCNQGKATAATCPSGQFFNKDNRGCVPKAQATCVDSDVNPCEGITGEKFVAKPNSCSGYFYCKNQVGTEGACPGELIFNPKDQACQYKTETGCSSTGGGSNTIEDNPDLVCAYIPNGIFFGSASNCATWVKCTNNKLDSGTCAKDQAFNVQSQSCVWANTYQCQQLKGDSSETGGTPPSSCTSGKDPEIKPNPDSCSSYLQCSDTKYVVTKCPSGQYFDEDSKKCTNRKDAKNDCDRCEGTTLTFVNAYQDDCRGYLICSNGKQVGSGKCGTGYYFNEVYASCVNATHPGFGVCTRPCAACCSENVNLCSTEAYKATCKEEPKECCSEEKVVDICTDDCIEDDEIIEVGCCDELKTACAANKENIETCATTNKNDCCKKTTNTCDPDNICPASCCSEYKNTCTTQTDIDTCTGPDEKKAKCCTQKANTCADTIDCEPTTCNADLKI